MAAVEQSLPSGERSPGLLNSSVGRKMAMAFSGVVLFGFVTVHMLGNIQAYMGRATMNAYAEFLQHSLHGGGIWIFRSVLLAAVGVHGWAALSLTLDNWKARPQGYRAQQLQAAIWSSRTMRWSGVVLAAFIVYHLLHLTTGQAHPNFIPGDAYANFVAGFKVLPVSAFYVLAMCALGLHLYHGVWSMTQTLGLDHPRYNPLRRVAAGAFAGLITVVNISFPVAVLAGIIR